MSSSIAADSIQDTRVSHTGDHERFAHYFRKVDLDSAFLEGKTITALCGKKDCPTRDFTKYPVCPSCQEVYEELPPGIQF